MLIADDYRMPPGGSGGGRVFVTLTPPDRSGHQFFAVPTSARTRTCPGIVASASHGVTLWNRCFDYYIQMIVASANNPVNVLHA